MMGTRPVWSWNAHIQIQSQVDALKHNNQFTYFLYAVRVDMLWSPWTNSMTSPFNPSLYCMWNSNRVAISNLMVPSCRLRACRHENHHAMALAWESLKSHWLRVSQVPPHFRFTWGQFRTTTNFIFNGWKNLHGIPHGKYGQCWLGL